MRRENTYFGRNCPFFSQRPNLPGTMLGFEGTEDINGLKEFKVWWEETNDNDEE